MTTTRAGTECSIGMKHSVLFMVFCLCVGCNLRSKVPNPDRVQLDTINKQKKKNDSLCIRSKVYSVIVDSLESDVTHIKMTQYLGSQWLYYQEVIGYDYLTLDTFEIVNGSLIDTVCRLVKTINHDELTGQTYSTDSHWIHPPRSGYFKILELNAFPYYRANDSLWTYHLIITNEKHWEDKRWLEWEGDINSRTEYKFSHSTDFMTSTGTTLSCKVIEATTHLDNVDKFTRSVFYYNEVYGFVYLEFNTVNGAVVKLSL